MNLKNILSITEARNNLFKITDQAQKSGARFTLTEHGRPKAVVMSVEKFESWRETLEVMKNFPDLKKDIKQAERDYKKGNYITLDELLAKEGYVLADKGKKRYGVQTCHPKKCSKRYKKNRMKKSRTYSAFRLMF